MSALADLIRKPPEANVSNVSNVSVSKRPEHETPPAPEQDTTLATLATLALAGSPSGGAPPLAQDTTLATLATLALANGQSTKTPPATAAELAAVNAWLVHIGEADQAIIDEVVELVGREVSARTYYLERARATTHVSQAPASAPAAPPPPVTCGSCSHFERNGINPDGGLGFCSVSAAQRYGAPPFYPFAKRQCHGWTEETNG